MSIYAKLIAIQSKLKAPKSQYNSFGKYSYRNCEDILEAVKPLLASNGCTLIVSDTVEMIGDRYYIKATARLIDIETGETAEASALAREEESKKGMDASQVTGATSSYARKYCLNGLFGIDDNKDADASIPAPTAKAQPKTAPKAEPQGYTCTACKKTITDADGATAENIAKATIKKYGKPFCKACIDIKKQRDAEAEAYKNALANGEAPLLVKEA